MSYPNDRAFDLKNSHLNELDVGNRSVALTEKKNFLQPPRKRIREIIQGTSSILYTIKFGPEFCVLSLLYSLLTFNKILILLFAFLPLFFHARFLRSHNLFAGYLYLPFLNSDFDRLALFLHLKIGAYSNFASSYFLQCMPLGHYCFVYALMAYCVNIIFYISEKMAKTSHDSDRFMLRLPDGMRERIKKSADYNNRSMNAEIIARLEGSYKTISFDMSKDVIEAVIAARKSGKNIKGEIAERLKQTFNPTVAVDRDSCKEIKAVKEAQRELRKNSMALSHAIQSLEKVIRNHKGASVADFKIKKSD